MAVAFVSKDTHHGHLSFFVVLHRPQVDQCGQVFKTVLARIDLLDGTRGGEADRDDLQGGYLEFGLFDPRDVHGYTPFPTIFTNASAFPDWIELYT